jgi:hypothetical protein
MGKDLTESDYSLLISKWLDDRLAESIEWHKVKGYPTRRELDVYSQGFRVGWLDAISTLKLHGFLTLP